MKKQLLLLATAAMAVTGVYADNVDKAPQVLSNTNLTQVSPNGKWGVSYDMYNGVFALINFETGDNFTMTGVDQVFLGSGNCVSDNGIALLSTTYDGTPSYVKDGKIADLPLLPTDFSAFSNGITPDGNRIVGTLGLPMVIDAVDVMQKPVIWDLQADGTYGMYKLLPYPETDWTGRLPQYVLANSISADGKTIIGQVRDYQGFVCEPIVWREDEKGEWAYEMLHPELINPTAMVFPEDPGESPEQPNYEDFMTEEELEAYNSALANYDWNSDDPYPAFTDYMTEAERDAYNKAYADYEIAFAQWWDKFEAFYNAIDEASAGAMQFSMNSTILSLNGRYYATMHQKSDWFDPAGTESYPVVFDLLTGDYYTYKSDDVTLTVSYINDEGILLASAPALDMTRQIYISDKLGEEMVPFKDWIAEKNPLLYQWMKENCVHDVTQYDYDFETGEILEVVIPDQWLDGTATADAAFTTLYSWQYNNWDDSSATLISYVMPLDTTSGIADCVLKGSLVNVQCAKGGIVNVVGGASSVEVYDMTGRKVYVNHSPASVINTGLKSGLYNVRVTDANGKAVVTKVVF